MDTRTARRFASRKFYLAAWIAVVALPVLLWFDRIDAVHFVDALKWTFGLYCAGNVASKFTGEDTGTNPSGGG